MISKPSKSLIFATDLHWIVNGVSILSSDATKQKIIATTNADPSENENEWRPEHLLLNAVISSLLCTYLDAAKKINLETSGFECTATGQVDIVDGKYKFSFIHIYPKVFVKKNTDVEKALVTLEKAKRSCPIYQSINAEIVQHPEVVTIKEKNEAA